MDLSSEQNQDEARIMERQLYRPGQSTPAPKTSSATSSRSFAPSTLPSTKRSVDKSSETPSKGKRIIVALLLGGVGYFLVYGTATQRKKTLVSLGVALWLFMLGGISYCVFLPDPVEEARRELAYIRQDKNLSNEEKREKSREVFSNMTDAQRDRMFAPPQEVRVKMKENLNNFFKLSPEEQVKKVTEDIKRDEQRRAERRRSGGGRGWGGGAPAAGGGRPGGGAAAGGASGGARPGGGAAAGGGVGGGAAAGGGRPGGGGPGMGGPGMGGAPGGGRGWGGGGGDRNARQKNRLNRTDPETRAQFGYQRGLRNQVRQQMGLPTGGFGGRR